MVDCALILAAGSGRRMGSDLPKSLLPLGHGNEPSFLTRVLGLLLPAVVERAFVVVREPDAGTFAAALTAGVGPAGVELVTVPPTIPGCDRPGSTVSLLHGCEAVRRWRPGGAGTLVMDADIVFERAVLDEVVARCDASRLFSIDGANGDGEEVRVYGPRPDEPVLLGKGLPPQVTAGLASLGESLGVIHLQPREQLLATEVAAWLLGTPPGFTGGHGYSGLRSEHEEVWQYLFALRRLGGAVLPGGLLFSECDFAEDYERVRSELYPAIRARDDARLPGGSS